MSGRHHIYQDCGNHGCRSKTDKTLDGVNFWGQPCHDIRRDDEGRQYSVCVICGHGAGFRDPDDISKTSYPYYNSSADKVFSDKYSERKWARDNGMVVKDYMGHNRPRRSS